MSEYYAEELKKYAGMISGGLGLGKALGYIPGKIIEGVGKLTSKVLPAVTAPISPVLTGASNIASEAMTIGGKGALTGAGAAGAVGLGMAHSIGSGVMKGVVAPTAGMIGRRFQKAPIGTSLNALAAYGAAGSVAPHLMGQTYASKLQGVNAHNPQGFMRKKFNPSVALEDSFLNRTGEEKMKPLRMRDFEKAAGFTKTAVFGLTKDDATKMLLIPAILGGVGAIAAPAFQNVGEKLRKKLFGAQDVMDEERATEVGKGLGKQDATDIIAAKEMALREKYTRPEMMGIYENLRKHDDVIGQAHGDAKLKETMHNTLDTVYSFAPAIATNKAALRSILREAATSPEGGLSFQTIKHIADAQKTIVGGEGKK